MKNLILTFVFALVSLVSFTQDFENFTVDCYVYHNDGGVFTTSITQSDTIYVTTTDSLIFSSSEFVSLFSGLDPVPQYIWSDDSIISALQFTSHDTIVYIFDTPPTPLFLTVIVGDQSASTQENTLTREELKVYPSPATSDIKISFSADKSDMPLNIFSLNGQLIFSDTNKREKGMNVFDLNVNEFVPGIYFVKVGNHTEKLIIE